MWRSHFFFRQTAPMSEYAGLGSLMMSAIARPKLHISAHADYRRSDYMFPGRSRPLSASSNGNARHGASAHGAK
jgi:hypothetical protein